MMQKIEFSTLLFFHFQTMTNYCFVFKNASLAKPLPNALLMGASLTAKSVHPFKKKLS